MGDTQTANHGHPLLAGLRAARANVVPGGIVQLMMLSLALSYYFYPPVQNVLNSLAQFRERTGFFFSAGITICGGALLPETLSIICFQRGRIQRKNFIDLLFLIPFWAFIGVWTDVFYKFQGVLFGNNPDVSTVICKVAFDQFVYTPAMGVPLCLFYYRWKDQRGDFRGIPNYWNPRTYFELSLPALIGAWGIWIPLTSIMYALPKNLQIPLFGLATSLWVLLLLFMTRNETKRHEQPPTTIEPRLEV